MIWGCMTTRGPGYKCRIEGTINQESYMEILKDELQQTFEYYELNAFRVYFQQDNAPCHTDAMVRE